MMETAYPSLVDLDAAYAAGTQMPTAVIGTHLDRIATLDPQIGAYQAVYADQAMQQAEAAEKMRASGQSLGPFHGIPFALKDICDLAGQITTGGSQAMAGHVSAKTGTMVQRLLAAGGIVLGKAKTVECAFGGWGTNQHMGTPRNPWDMANHRICGGSSSGTGASVASGMAICGVGTDTGGSVRLPAGFCGLVGLKVTEGRLPVDGILPLSHTLDTPGPMARSVIDAAVMFLVMDGVPGHQIAYDLAAKENIFGVIEQGVKGLRLGVLSTSERAECSADVLAGYDAALELFRAQGAELAVFEAGTPYAELTEECGRLIATEAWFHHSHLFGDPNRPLDDDVRARMLTGRDVSAGTYMTLLRNRGAGRDSYLRRLAGFDALLTPSMTTTAPQLQDVDQAVSPGHFTRHVNHFGLCALSVPSGLTADGLPTSLQIIARPHSEDIALRIGAAYERARPEFHYPHFTQLS